MSAVNRMKVDRFAMEFNSPVGIELQALSDFPDDKLLGIGVIEPKVAKVEKPESIVERVEKALQFVDKKKIGLNYFIFCLLIKTYSQEILNSNLCLQ